MTAFKFFNIKGDLFATTFSFGMQAVIKLCSSLILTRILQPESYGVVTIVMSIVFVVEMLADLGVTVFVVRDKHGENPTYLNTAWTLRLGRGLLNGAIMFLSAPLIARLYGTPLLEMPLRVFSLWFVIAGFESMSFPIAIRRKRSRLLMYSELTTTFISTLFAVTYCHYSRDYWGMLYATLLGRLLLTLFSRRFYPEFRPKLQFDRQAARDMFQLTKFVLPSSFLSMVLLQFDKVVFLRLFDLRLLGLYGLAGGIAGPIDGLITNICRMVLYPRCAHNFREHRDTFAQRYYTENVKLFATVLTLPAAIFGAADLIIAVLYPARYAQSAPILRAFMVRALLLSATTPAEELLVATGESHVILMGNLFRAGWVFTATFAGYYIAGFPGFMYGAALAGVPPLAYYFWLQHKKGMLIVKYELLKAGFALGIAASAYMAASLLLSTWPNLHLRH